MRTTITLDDGLLADLIRRARSEGKSLSAVIAEALHAQLGKRQVTAKATRFRLVTVKGRRLRPDVEIRTRTLEEEEDIERWTRPRRP
jgi:Arc/MetJ family transcription regulator